MTMLIGNINVVEKNSEPSRKIEFKVFKFNDGSIKVRLATSISVVQNLKEVDFTFAPYNTSDAMIAIQMVSILKHFNPNLVIDLIYASTLYTRYDRIMHSNKSDAFGLKCFIESIRPLLLQVTTVTLLDVHNDKVIANLILDQNKNLAVYQYSLQDLIKTSINELSEYHIVAPDEGSEKRLREIGIQSDVTFGKSRSPDTGQLGLVYVIKPLSNPVKPYLIVDDIVEYGNTHIQVSSKLSINFDKLLYVTYGVLPTEQSIINLSEKFDKIYIHICHESVYSRIKQLVLTNSIPSDKFIIQVVMEQSYYV